MISWSSSLECSFFIIGSMLHLKYHNEGKRKITDAFQSIYLSGNFPEKWHPVHRFISLHSLQWYRVPTIQPPHPSHHTLKNKEFYLSFTLMFTKYWASYSINCGLRISWAWVRILMPFFFIEFDLSLGFFHAPRVAPRGYLSPQIPTCLDLIRSKIY